MISILKCYARVWRYKQYFRNEARNNPRIIGHVRQLNETVEQVNQMLQDASAQVESAARLYDETFKEFVSQDLGYPDIIGPKLGKVRDKYSYQLKRLHTLEKLRDELEAIRKRALVICGFNATADA